MEAYIYHISSIVLTQTGAVAFDDGEDIQWELRPKAEVKEMLLKGAFRHPHTVCGLLAYFANSFKS